MNIIVGAGPAGMFCAYELRKNNLESLIIEKKKYIGGLASTHKNGKFNFEIGPHIIYTKDEYFIKIVKEILGDDLILKNWSVSQYIQGKYFIFPNSAWDMTKKLGMLKMFGFLISYLIGRGKKHTDYEGFIHSKVGKKLADFNIINYTQKMWGVSLDKLETEWIKPRLDRLSLIDIFKNTIRPKNRSFYYPRYGSGQLYSLMQKELNVKCEEWPTKIIHDNYAIEKIETNKSSFTPDHLFSSLPLIELLNLFSPIPPKEVLEAAKNLQYRSQVYVALHFDESFFLDNQWIYFNEPDIPFCRVHEPKKFSDINLDSKYTTLVAEYFCFVHDEVWNKSDESLVSSTLKILKKIGIVDNDVLLTNSNVLRTKYAYPMMINSRKENVNIVMDYLNTFSNFTTIGRHGLHTYDNQDTAARSSINAVHSLIKNILTLFFSLFFAGYDI